MKIKVGNNYNSFLAFKLAFLCAFLLLLLWSYFYAQEERNATRDINSMYKEAMDCFYKKEYKRAIQYWSEVLKIDPSQKNPQKLIDMARSKMAESIKPLNEEYNKALDKGEYEEALKKVTELFDCDPTNVVWKKQKEKLEKFITAVGPSITGNDKISIILRKSVNAYLERIKDNRLAVLASRYAWQLDKNNKIAELTFILMDKEYTVIARMEVMDNKKTVVEQKLDASLEAIYDSKYDLALAEIQLVVALEPDIAIAWKRMGSIYYALGKLKEAKSAWEKAMSLDPTDQEIKKFYAKVK